MTRGQLWVLAGALLLTGCASAVPEPIRTAPSGDVRLAEVRREPEAFRGNPVRWGGHIIAVRNRTNETLIEVVSRRLDSDGRPLAEDLTEGRFLVVTPGFLDPAVYAAGREMTVRGRLEGTIEESIGEFRYRYPLVRAEHLHLWTPRPPPLPPYPYHYDPWWDPWYPWGWPYRPPYP